MPFNTKRKRGFTLPGYNFLGPFNDLNGEPTNDSDRVAKKHDVGYKLLQLSGSNPYIEWNNADADAQSKWGKDYGGRIAAGYFGLKRTAATVGLLRNSTWKQRKIAFDGTPNNPRSFLKSQSSAQATMTDGRGSGNPAGLTETPVDPVPSQVHRGPPDYTYASLPYLEDFWFYSGIAVGDPIYTSDHWFRLTSPYDPAIITGITDANLAAGVLRTSSDTVVDSALRKADWFDFYAGLYKYYHVVACQWHVMIENLGEPIWVYQMFANDERPPVLASNMDMQTWRGVNYKYVNSAWKSVNANGILQTGVVINNDEMDEDSPGANDVQDQYSGSNNIQSKSGTDIVTFSGTYRPGDYNRDIRLDSEVENWTAVNTNPAVPERLLIRVKPLTDYQPDTDGTIDAGDTLRYHMRTHLEYLVEFKELNTGLKYPTTRQPLAITINQDTRLAG